jgi:hypothetical protein
MEIEFIDIRETFESGGSVKVTIPMEMVRRWEKTKERLSEGMPGMLLISIKKFPICYIRNDGKLILELPENIMKSGDYPTELIEKVREALIKLRVGEFSNQYESYLREFISGRISEQEFNNEAGKISESLRNEAKGYVNSLGKRELHFVATDDMEQLLATESMDEERKNEENFHSLMDDVKKIKDEADEIKGLIEKLEKGYQQKKISKIKYEIFRERLLGKETLIENRLKRLQKLVCSWKEKN